MKFTKWKAAGIAAVAAALAFTSSGANAVSSTSTTDGDGVDYDAACVVAQPTPPPGPNSIKSAGNPGGSLAHPSGGDGCDGVSVYDGSTEATDLVDTTNTNTCPGVNAALGWSVCFASTTAPPPPTGSGIDRMYGGVNVDETALPAAGSSTAPTGASPALDTPHVIFGGAQYFVMFQNKDKQTNIPTNPVGGCPRNPTGTVIDQYESWKDGFHFWLSYSVHFNGDEWIHSVKVGEYDPSPTGGFLFIELGYQDSGGWHDVDPALVKGINWDVSVNVNAAGTSIVMWLDGVFGTSDALNCANGIRKWAYAEPGDTIANVKGLTTADQVVVLPVTVPLSDLCGPSGGEVCEPDLKSVGGFVYFSDTSDGTSTDGKVQGSTPAVNISGIAYTGGAIGVSNTLGQGPTCPTPTLGGLLPPNQLFTPDTACHIDDDQIARGSFLSEFWETTHGGTF